MEGKDWASAVKWWEAAAAQDNYDAMVSLASLYINGRPGQSLSIIRYVIINFQWINL
jgi:TPR repeat protein